MKSEVLIWQYHLEEFLKLEVEKRNGDEYNNDAIDELYSSIELSY